MDRFSEMQMFVRIVEAGSLSGAADRMNIAKSAVSRRLTELEARLGVALLRRTTRRINLTDSGMAYYERCQRILADVEETERAISQTHGELRGTLRVALPLSFGLRQLAPLINAFMTRHPEVRFDLDFNDRQVDLLQEGIDVAIRIAELDDSSLIARRLAPIPHIVCASPDYLANHGTPRQAADLANHAGLIYGNTNSPNVWTYRAPTGEMGTVRLPVKLRANNGDMLLQAAIAGAGVLLIPTFFLPDALQNDQLRPLLTDHQWPQLNVYAVYPPTRHLSTRVRALIDFLADALTEMPT